MKRFIEHPAAGMNEAHLGNVTASGPPLPVLLRSLEILRDMRVAAKREGISSRHEDFARLRAMLN